MNVLFTIITIITLIVSLLLIGIVLIQKSKGGGLSSQFGGANSMMGVRQTNSFLEKGTWCLAALIVILSVASSATMSAGSGEEGPKANIPVEQTAGGNGGEQFPTAAPAAAPTEAPAAAPAEAPTQAPAPEAK